MSEKDSRYFKRGVSFSKSTVHKAIQGLDKGLYDRAFCKILPDYVGSDQDYCNIMHADTAGTKGSLAYIYWKETGDLSVWRGIVQDAIVMNLDDMACIGCVNDIILSSTVGRNAHLISGDVVGEVINSSFDFIAQMRDLGVNLYHAGGETADVGDIVRTIDVGYTAFARMKKKDLIVNDIQPGDYIVGLASYGQTTYEDEYNGGMGSNGLTSARHDVLTKSYLEKYSESFDPNTDREFIYSGSKKLTDKVDINGDSIDVGKLILSPTRTFLPVLIPILDQFKSLINGMIHCTGGAQTKVMKFVENRHIIKDNLLPIPPLFELIQSESNADWKEMYAVFNMGHRMEIYTSDLAAANEMVSICKSFDLNAQIIGRVEAHDGNKLTIESQAGTFHWAD